MSNVHSESASAAPATPAAASGRDGNGRFAAGNAGGPGNPFARRTAALRKACLDEVKPEDLRAVFRKLITMSLDGDKVAMKLLFQYSLGKPAEQRGRIRAQRTCSSPRPARTR